MIGIEEEGDRVLHAHADERDVALAKFLLLVDNLLRGRMDLDTALGK